MSSHIPANNSSSSMVLVVEDHAASALVAGTLLEQFGYRYEIVINGREALTKLSQSTFDLILMDIRMAKMDGIQTTHIIRDDENTNGGDHIPILAITANALKEDKDLCLAAGMDDYLSKPYQFSEFLEKVKQLLKRNSQSKAA